MSLTHLLQSSCKVREVSLHEGVEKLAHTPSSADLPGEALQRLSEFKTGSLS